MSIQYNLGIIGCGDFLRLQESWLKVSRSINVKRLYDPDKDKLDKYAGTFSAAETTGSPEALIEDPGIDIVALFVPPAVRKELFLAAAAAGKAIITTNPLAVRPEDCRQMLEAVENKTLCGLIYSRTGDPLCELYKTIFASGEVGKLLLYKQDILHHYPQWNNWATDPELSGGPFMHAMIHNLNISRYLMEQPVTHCTFFSENHVQKLTCNDTEFLKVDFASRGAAYLFITWAADLAVHRKDGNYREQIDLSSMITTDGWRLTHRNDNGSYIVNASREGRTKTWRAIPLAETPYDSFAASLSSGKSLRRDFVEVCIACEDILILSQGAAKKGQRVAVKLD